MADARRASVTIDQPTANKATVFALAGGAAFVAMVFISKIDAALFQAGLAIFALAACVYAYRAIAVSAVADRDGITVTNLRHTTRHRWSDVEVMSVGPVPRGPGNGVWVNLTNGTSVPVEASWGAWFEGKRGAANTARCERVRVAIDTMRAAPRAAPSPEPTTEPPPDPISIRCMTPEDAQIAAEVLKTAWTETYGDLLSHQALYERDVEEDSNMLIELTNGSIPAAGGLIAEHEGEVVGLSVFGPANSRDPDLEDHVELYMLYVLDSERTSHVGTRLTVRTMYALRSAGAQGVVAHVHAGHRRLTRRIEALGIERHGEVAEQNWYGLPVKVIEYRKAFDPVPASR